MALPQIMTDNPRTAGAIATGASGVLAGGVGGAAIGSAVGLLRHLLSKHKKGDSALGAMGKGALVGGGIGAGVGGGVGAINGAVNGPEAVKIINGG